MADYTVEASKTYADNVLKSLFYATIREWSVQVRGNLRESAVIDFGCGAGNETRLLKTRYGAAKVTGLDLSPNMIDLARQTEDTAPLGIDYLVADASAVPESLHGVYDAAVSNFSLCYAENVDQLTTMLKQQFACLKPGGRIVNATIDPAQGAAYERKNREFRELYNIWYSEYDTTLKDGQALKFNVVTASGEHSQYGNYFYSPDTYSACAHAAGFVNVSIVVPTGQNVPELFDTEEVQQHAARVLAEPHMFFVCAERPLI